MKNSEELEPAAIYEILARKNNHEDWKTWPEAEKNLYDSEKYAPVLDSIKTKNKEEIDFFMFKQEGGEECANLIVDLVKSCRNRNNW